MINFKDMKIKTIVKLALVIGIGTLYSCKNSGSESDASGVFEAEEVIVSSEANGVIKQLTIDDGSEVKAQQIIGYVDSTQLYLKKKQLEAQIFALLSKRPDVTKQLASFEVQLQAAVKEQKRVENLLKSDAATTKQLDDVNAQIEVLKKQIEAQRSSLAISVDGLSNEATALQIQIEQLNDQLENSRIINPISGTVLTCYAKQDEMTAYGKPLYKVADLSQIILRVYITGDQLPQIKLGQKVSVFTDNGDEKLQKTGEVIWISDKAEFTPKTILTKNERANLVYAVKVKVPNDGTYKIGMYGEISFLIEN